MNAWLNLFRRTPREYFADFFITPPITLGLLIVSLQGFDLWWPVKFAGGMLIWSFYEYMAHRFIAHRVPYFREAHALHHQAQRDYISLHPIMSLAMYGAFWMLFGFGSGAISVGFSTGYVVYSFAHTAFHYATIEPGHFMYGLKMRHVLHHRADCNYGVVTGFWDRIFGTTMPKIERD
jgi:sterol desaturase/sphingolipid hydroxylase (fatty acid hydroxylase superfamily)